MSKNSHHHGDLREALICAGMELLAKGERLTLRGAAQLAGVSHSAPAHHFDGLNGLRTAIAARAMQIMVEKLTEAGQKPDRTGFERLLDMTGAYCDFAAEHRYLFYLMFASPDVNRDDDELLRASLCAYAQLAHACAEFVPEGKNGWVLEHAVWSLTHGNAVLLLQSDCRNSLAPTIAPSLDKQFRVLLNLNN